MIRKVNVSSNSLNTFHIDVVFSELYTISSKKDFEKIPELAHDGFKILGGGSNILLTCDIRFLFFG